MTTPPDITARAARRADAARSRSSGFTIIEMVVTLIVVGLIVTLAAPSMSQMIARHRVQGVQAELLGDLQLARSEQARRNGNVESVSVSFGSNADMTCYTIHTGATACDCTRSPGDACSAVPTAQELKTMQFARTAGVSVAASSASAPRIVFSPPQGLVTPTDVVIDVLSTTRGQLRTSINQTGVPTTCTPDGSIPGVATC